MINEILKALDLDGNTIAKKKFGKNKEITIAMLVEALLNTDTVVQAAEKLGISPSTMGRTIKTSLPPMESNSWKLHLRSLAGVKLCSSCKQLKPLDNFDKRGKIKATRCKSCLKEYRLNNKEYLAEVGKNHRARNKAHIAQYQKDNRDKVYASNAKYRASKIGATPKWADYDKIAEIYANCPEGYEVDHVVPLQGENVCGLHVETNLQYLTVFENRSKGNKFES